MSKYLGNFAFVNISQPLHCACTNRTKHVGEAWINSIWYEAVQANWRIEGWTVNFRMTSAAFRSLCEQLKPYVKKKSTNYRDYICAPICVGISLYFCAVQLNTGR